MPSNMRSELRARKRFSAHPSFSSGRDLSRAFKKAFAAASSGNLTRASKTAKSGPFNRSRPDSNGVRAAREDVHTNGSNGAQTRSLRPLESTYTATLPPPSELNPQMRFLKSNPCMLKKACRFSGALQLYSA